MQKDFIKEYWEHQGKTHQDSHWASWGDNWIIDLEIENISSYIEDGCSVLDMGCGNGYSTFKQYERHNLKNIVGVDFAENMIATANENLKKHNLNNMRFEQGDVRQINFSDETFDVVYTTRVIINLPTWQEQQKAISECLRVTKKNGFVILSEGFWEPLVLLNSFRLLCGLEPLVEHDFNRYLKKTKLEAFIAELGYNYEINDFSSIYYLGSRLLRELVTDHESYEGFSNPINKIFADIQRNYKGGGFGIQQAFVIRK